MTWRADVYYRMKEYLQKFAMECFVKYKYCCLDWKNVCSVVKINFIADVNILLKVIEKIKYLTNIEETSAGSPSGL